MSLYTPAAFATDDKGAIARLIQDHPFATLVTPASPEPFVSHVPLLLREGDGPHGHLVGHFARANPQAEAAQRVESIAIFHGPHAYVSPSWYREPAKGVPTWNYATVHVYGTLERVADATEARAVLDMLVARFEGGRAAPWSFEMAPPQSDALVGAIAAFRLRIRRLDAKFKLSQNRPPADRVRVIDALEAEGYPEATATAAWMRAFAPPPQGKA